MNSPLSAAGSVLILGARGRLGAALVQAFAAQRWSVRAQVRPGPRGGAGVPALPGVQVCAVDLADTAALQHAAAGATVVVHAVNPSRYAAPNWAREAPPQLEAALAVTRGLGARLLFPGNVYPWGPGMPARLAPDTPVGPGTPLGRVRLALEHRLAEAAQQGLPVTLIRAGDFYGGGRGTWLDLMIARRLPQGRVTWPGALDTPHAWAYLPDLAQAFVRVAQAPAAPVGGALERLHFAGHTVTGRDWLAALAAAARAQGWLAPDAALRLDSPPWRLMALLAPFVPAVASLRQMRYLWDEPHALDGTALAQRIGAEPHTPFAQAVGAAIAALALAPPGAQTLPAGAGRTAAGGA